MNTKHFFLLYLFFLLVSNSLFAQLAVIDKARHLKGQQGIEANIGITQLGKFFNLGYSRNLSHTVYAKFQAGAEAGNYAKKIYSFISYTADAGIYYAPINIEKILYIGGNAGISLNMDKVKSSEMQSRNFTNYGAFIGAEAECFVSDRFVLLANFKQKFLLNQQYGSLVYFAGVGLKYVIL